MLVTNEAFDPEEFMISKETLKGKVNLCKLSFGENREILTCCELEQVEGSPQCYVSPDVVPKMFPDWYWTRGDWSAYMSWSRGFLGCSDQEMLAFRTDFEPFLEFLFPTLQNHWYTASSLFAIPGGQLKNFFVACATIRMALDNGAPPHMRISVIGSKVGAAGGVWHEDFVRYCLLQGCTGTIDLWDSGQEEYRRTYSCTHPVTKMDLIFYVRAHNGWYEGNGSEYDVVIDDMYAWESAGTTKWLAKYYSQKRPGAEKVFFHDHEGRTFSHPVHWFTPGIVGQCQCPRCCFSRYAGRHCFTWFLAVSYRIQPSPCYSCPDASFLSEEWLSITRYGVFSDGDGPAYERARSMLSERPGFDVLFKDSVVFFYGVDPQDFGYKLPSRRGTKVEFSVVADVRMLPDVEPSRYYIFKAGKRPPGYKDSGLIAPHGWEVSEPDYELPDPVFDLDLCYSTEEYGPVCVNPQSQDFKALNFGLASGDEIRDGYCFRHLTQMSSSHICYPFDYFCVLCQKKTHSCDHSTSSLFCYDCRLLSPMGCGLHRHNALGKQRFTLGSGIDDIALTIISARRDCTQNIVHELTFDIGPLEYVLAPTKGDTRFDRGWWGSKTPQRKPGLKVKKKERDKIDLATKVSRQSFMKLLMGGQNSQFKKGVDRLMAEIRAHGYRRVLLTYKDAAFLAMSLGEWVVSCFPRSCFIHHVT